jgi:hypothetical protein
MPFKKIHLRIAVSAILTALITLAVLARFLDADQYAAFAGAIQALIVVPALIVGVATLLSDRHDRRVDRVLEFHQELVSGELQAARTRLTRHLREHGTGGKPRRVTRDELKSDPALKEYSGTSEFSPTGDFNQILRYFERVDCARLANSVDLPLLAELVGRHAVWLDLAIEIKPEAPAYHM